VPEKEERVGAYEYVAHKRYTRPMVIIQSGTLAFPHIFCQRQEKKEGMLEKENTANSKEKVNKQYTKRRHDIQRRRAALRSLLLESAKLGG